MVAQLADEPPFTRSHAEEILLRVVAEHGLPRPATNVVLAGHEVDALWPAARLVVELDGWDTHRMRIAFEPDRRRDQDLRDAGHVVERLTWRQLDREPQRVAALIERRLRGGGARFPR